METVQQLQSHLDVVPISVQFIIASAILGLAYNYLTAERPNPTLPVIRSDRTGWQAYLPAAITWARDGKDIQAKGLRECNGPFQVQTGSGYKLIVPNRFAEELKSHPSLNFNEAFAKDFFAKYPGFDGMRQGLEDDSFMQEVVRVKLTQSLGLVTDDLVEETDASLNDIFTGVNAQSDWQTRKIKDDLLDLVARLSSRVFLGKELCRNQDWLRITKNYTVDTFMASAILRMIPSFVRPVAFWFIPTCTRLRGEVKDARRLVMSEVDQRRQRAETSLAAGEKPPKMADAIGWMVEVAAKQGREVDLVAAQLGLSTAAIHTTSETMSKCIYQMCATPEIIHPLREEIVNVLKTEGWSKQSLYKLKLMDSFLKEVQRTNGLASSKTEVPTSPSAHFQLTQPASMNRLVKSPVTLSNGTTLPAGCRIMVSNDKVHSDDAYPEAAKFDVARFMNLRQQPGNENKHQFVTTTAEHMGFGHGQHACPGRFFASNEIKIALCFMLLRYDWQFVPGEEPPRNMEFETISSTNPELRVQMRRRREEVDLMGPQSQAVRDMCCYDSVSV